jgi:hypothetical protein
MATFPTLTPSSRTFTPGRHPHSEIGTLSGLQTRVRTSNVILDQLLRLSFAALTEQQMLSIRAHYIGQQGRFLSFAIPNDLLSGTTTPSSFTPTGYSWTYAAPPQISDVACGRYDVSVELATVPPEGANINGAEFTVGTYIITEMVAAVSSTFAAGAASVVPAGLDLTVTTTFAAGAAAGAPVFTWDNPDTGNPPANSYRLYASGFARLSTTTSAGYKKDELLAGLTTSRSVTVLVNSVTHTGTVSTAGALEDAGTSTERVTATFSMSPAFTDTTLSDTAMTLTLL